jgi:hypothetical protein
MLISTVSSNPTLHMDSKDEENIIQKIKELPIEEDDHFPRATHLA